MPLQLEHLHGRCLCRRHLFCLDPSSRDLNECICPHQFGNNEMWPFLR